MAINWAEIARQYGLSRGRDRQHGTSKLNKPAGRSPSCGCPCQDSLGLIVLVALLLAGLGFQGRFGLPDPRQQLLDFSLQAGKLLLHPPVAHGLVLGSISAHLGAIQSYMPQLHQPRQLAQLEDLHKQLRQRLQMAAPSSQQ